MARPRSDEKIEAILDAARSSLGTHGFAASTINQIARQAGVSRGLLHYYFESKEDLLNQAVARNVEGSVELVAAVFSECSTADDLAARLANALRVMARHDPAFFGLLFECWLIARSEDPPGPFSELFNRFRDAMTSQLSAARDRQLVRPDLQPEATAALLTAMMHGLALQILVDERLGRSQPLWETFERQVRELLREPR
jgi:AcrR family transcriptional regulator